jgi:hypothetical protein
MKMSTNASYNFRRGSSAVCVTGPRRTVFGPQNAQVSRTFAHSGSIVNHKGGNIFVVSHFAAIFLFVCMFQRSVDEELSRIVCLWSQER